LEEYNCAVRGCQQEETLHHLFWECPFAKRCWDYIYPSRTQNLSVFEAMQDIKEHIRLPFTMEIIILGSCAIWITRNNKFFENIPPTFQGWKHIYLQELKLLTHRIKNEYVV
jgi:hypothetical protein